MTTNSNTNVVIRQFSGIPYVYSFFNSSGSILLHIQYLISLAYLSKMNLNFDILHNIYELRKLININNVYDLFPNKTVEIVNNNLYLLGIQIARLSQENETIVRNSRYVEELLYFGPYLKSNCKDAHYHSEITVLKAKNYDHLIVAFPGVSSSDSLTAELRTVFSSYTTDLTKFPGLSGLLDANGDVIKDVFFIRGFIPFITHDDDDNCLDATEDTILTQYIVNETECLLTGYSSGACRALVKGILYAGKYPNIQFKVYVYALLKVYSNRITDLIDALPNLDVYVFNDSRDPIVGCFNILQMTNCDRYSPLFEEDDPLYVIPYQNELGLTSTKHITKNTFNLAYINNHLPSHLAALVDKYN